MASIMQTTKLWQAYERRQKDVENLTVKRKK